MIDHQPEYNMIIDANRVQKEYLKDIIRFRELFYFFAWRDILVRYKQAFFGVAWAIIRPFLNMVMFTLIFSRIANLPSDNVNYSLFVLAGMLPWQLVSGTMADNCICILNNANLISKIYFPRIIIPSAQIIVHLLDFAIGGVMLILLSVGMGSLNFLTFCTLPFFILLVFLLCLGSGFWLSAVTVQYRDFRLIIPFVVQIGMFISPVGYGSFLIPEKWIWFYYLNPMVGIIEGFRWAFFGISHPYFIISLIYSIVITLSILVSGFLYFRKMERTFADRV